MILRTLPLLALALLTAACAQSPQPSMAVPTPALPPIELLPPRAAMANALLALAECDPDEDEGCDAKPTAIRIDGDRCVPIAPEDGNVSAACRLDWTETMPPPGKDVAHRGACVRFILLEVEGSQTRLWAVRYTPPGHVCEMPR